MRWNLGTIPKANNVTITRVDMDFAGALRKIVGHFFETSRRHFLYLGSILRDIESRIEYCYFFKLVVL